MLRLRHREQIPKGLGDSCQGLQSVSSSSHPLGVLTHRLMHAEERILDVHYDGAVVKPVLIVALSGRVHEGCRHASSFREESR